MCKVGLSLRAEIFNVYSRDGFGSADVRNACLYMSIGASGKIVKL